LYRFLRCLSYLDLASHLCLLDLLLFTETLIFGHNSFIVLTKGKPFPQPFSPQNSLSRSLNIFYLYYFSGDHADSLQDSLKKTLEEDEERHGEPAKDRDTGEEVGKEEKLEEGDKKDKNKSDEESDDDDDSGGGGLLIPLIEWVGGLIPRLVKEPNKG